MAKPKLPWFMNQLVTGIVDLVKWFLSVILWGVNVVLLFLLLFLKTVMRIVKVFTIYMPRMIGGFIPTFVVTKLDQTLIYAGVEMTSEEVVGMTLVYSVILTLVTFILGKIFGLYGLGLFIACFMAFMIVLIFPTLLLNLLIFRRTDSVEKVLPDVLDMIAQNMSAGMTSYNALWSAARPEFGPLAVEIQAAARATLTGTPLPDALLRMTNRIQSDQLDRTIRLLIQGMRSGGELPAVLQGLSRDMRSEMNLRKQMQAETNAHAIFILFALLIGAPLLFSVSLRFITIFSQLYSKIDVDSLAKISQGGTITLKGLSISPDFFLKYTLAILAVSSIFGAFLVALIRTGRPISGIQNIPVLLVISIGILLILNYMLGIFFGSMFTM